MTIEEMHMMFREIGQMSGTQTTRAIFSENIDICINYAIQSKVRSIIHQNIGTNFPDKIVRDNAKLSPINGIYTLYTTGKVSAASISGQGSKHSPFSVNIDNDNVYLYIGFDCQYSDNEVNHCRLIERERLFDTFDDFCNRPSKHYPIVTTYGDDNHLRIEIYTGTKLPTVAPEAIIYTYIKKPAKVVLDEENAANTVDCDLPEYLHTEIVNDAVNYYLQSLNIKKGDSGGN